MNFNRHFLRATCLLLTFLFMVGVVRDEENFEFWSEKLRGSYSNVTGRCEYFTWPLSSRFDWICKQTSFEYSVSKFIL